MQCKRGGNYQNQHDYQPTNLKGDVMKKPPTVATNFVEYALDIGALKISPEGFKLKSGRMSPYFFNSGLFCSGKSIIQLAGAYAGPIDRMIIDFLPDDIVVFGLAYKGTFLAPTIAMQLAWKYHHDVGYSSNRKEEKDHGEGGIVLGASLRGKKVVLIDDVMTTGTSFREAVDIVRTNDGTPVCAMIAFDRQECGKDSKLSAVQEFEQEFGIPVRPAATLADLIAVLEDRLTDEHDHQQVGPILDKIRAYREKYGVS